MAGDSNSTEIKNDSKPEKEKGSDEAKKAEESTIENPEKRNQINQGLKDQSSEESVELIYQKKKSRSLNLTFWNVDMYLHQKYRNVNMVVRQVIEVVAFALVLLGPMLIYNFAYGEKLELDDIKGPSKGTTSDTLFRRNFFFVCIYALYSLLYVTGEYSIIFASKLLLYFGVSNSLISWGVLQSIYRNREFWIKAVLFFYAFNLSNYMYDPFSRTPFAFELNENIIKTFVLWFAILNMMVFVTKFVIDILTCKIKLSSYREQVRELNYKTFIFIKLKKISDAIAQKDDSTEVEGSEAYAYAESPEDIAENFKPSYDPGFYLTNKQFMTSSEDAELVANNIMVLLGKKALEYDDIAKYFPENSDNVFEFLSSGSNQSAKVKWKQLDKVAVDLCKRRKDVAASIRDRDGIFVDLEMIFVFLTYYLGLIVLLFMFDIDYKFLTVSIGGYLVSFTWVFADSIKNIYNCFLFLLIIRPYNIGDMVRIESSNYTVHKIELFESVFLSDGNILTYIPNTKLISQNIKNFSRSPPRSEVVEVAVSESTSYDQAQAAVRSLNKNIGDVNALFSHAELFKIEKGKLTFKIFYKKIDGDFEEIKAKRERIIKLCVKSLSNVEYLNSFVFVE